jgi:hypothetical protein
MFKKFYEWLNGVPAEENLEVGGLFGRMTPEALCGIEPEKMDRDEIRSVLARLYQRHNDAAGSLNPELREEAEQMLKAIVHCREKYVETAKA